MNDQREEEEGIGKVKREKQVRVYVRFYPSCVLNFPGFFSSFLLYLPLQFCCFNTCVLTVFCLSSELWVCFQGVSAGYTKPSHS